MKQLISFIIMMFTLPSIASSGEANIVAANLKETGNNTYRFEVTLQHADTGWNHYADKWEVVAPNGAVLATRVLAHPHVNEQPFTRSLSGVHIADEITRVEIRGHDSVHGFGGETLTVKFN